jgi:protein ImuA
MAQGGAAERAAFLRGAIARIEAANGPDREAANAPPRLPVARAIDRALGGGLAGDGLHEIAPATAADGAAATGFALALAARFCAASTHRAAVLLAIEDFCAVETGEPYGPGLAAFGLDPDRLVVIRAPDARALLWTLEEALKSGALAAVVGELGRAARRYDLTVSRRLLLAARAGRSPALIVHGPGQADALSTAAQTRFEIAAAPSRRRASAGGRLALPGAPIFSARVVKARPPPPDGVDEARIFRLEWRVDERCFGDPTVSLPVAAAAAGGPREEAAG